MSTSSSDYIIFSLLHKNRPWTDLMSKHVLLTNEVMNIITSQLTETEDNNQYLPRPTEWIDGKRSDVLYAADNNNASPPILIEVQYIADDDFLHRVVRYCEEVKKEYGAVPIVLIFVINKIRDTIYCKTTKDRNHPYLLKVPCYPWAKKCFFLTPDSIKGNLDSTPLSPLVALRAFFTAQKSSILDHSQRVDPTIQILYCLSKKIFENIVVDNNTAVDDLLSLCDTSESKIKEGISFLEESAGTGTHKRTIECLNDCLAVAKSYRLKYTTSKSSSAIPPSSSMSSSSTAAVQSPPPPPPPPSSSSSSTTTTTAAVVVVQPPSSSSPSSPSPAIPSLSSSSSTIKTFSELTARNWLFVENYMKSIGDNKMNWRVCFAEGKEQGFFDNYTSFQSLKNSYQRWKREQEK